MSSLRPPSSPPQLTIEKLISKGRVLTMANQVLAVNISEEVSSMNIWIEWTDRGAGDDWPIVWPLSDLPSCSAPRGGQALVRVIWEAGTDQTFSWDPKGWEGSKEEEGEHVGRGCSMWWKQCGSGYGGWSSFAGAGGIAEERGAKRARQAGPCTELQRRRRHWGWAGACWAGWVAHGALPQGRILLGPEGVPLRRVDVLAANGVIHMLEGILLPPTILPILPKHCNEEQHKIVAVSTRCAVSLP